MISSGYIVSFLNHVSLARFVPLRVYVISLSVVYGIVFQIEVSQKTVDGITQNDDRTYGCILNKHTYYHESDR